MLSYTKDQRRFVWLMLLPAFAIMAAFFLWPTLYNIRNSFTDLSLLGLRNGGSWIGFENYVELFYDPDFRKVVFNTLFWLTFVSVGLRLVLGFAIALFIESQLVRRMRLTMPLRMAALLPWATPDIVAVTVWKQILDGRSGAINNALTNWGLIDEPIVFLGNPTYVWPSIITIIVWNGLPIIILTMAAALQSVPKDLYEAADIDGAKSWIKFWHVTFPHALPALAVLGLLTTIWTFNNFVYVWLATGAGPGNFSNVLATEVFLQGFVNFKLGLSSAIGTFMAALAMVFGIIYFRAVVLKRFGGLAVSDYTLPDSRYAKAVRRKRGLAHRRSPFKVVLAAAFAALLIFFFAAPVVWIYWASFKPSAALIGSGTAGLGFTLENYINVWNNDFGRFMLNSLYICCVSVIISTALAACSAYVLSRYRFAYKKWLFGFIVLTQIFPWIVMVTPLFILFAQLDMINNHLAIMFCYVTITLPFSIYLMVGYLEALPRDLDEAALMDGCSRFEVMRHIILPLMVPGIVATATYSFLLMWTEFLLALALLTKTSLKTLPLGLALFFGEDTVDWGGVMAASALTTFPALLLFLPVQARLVAGLSAGSVKG